MICPSSPYNSLLCVRDWEEDTMARSGRFIKALSYDGRQTDQNLVNSASVPIPITVASWQGISDKGVGDLFSFHNESNFILRNPEIGYQNILMRDK